MPLFELRAKVSIDGGAAVIGTLRQVKEEAGGAAGGMNKATAALHAFGQGIASVVGSVLQLGQRLAGAAAGFAALSTAAGGALGVFAFNTSAKFDSLTRGLAGMAENADVLRGELIRLKDVAKLPGLGFEEAVQGSLALQSVGLSARESENALRAFGNALALAGHGKAELQETLNQIQQGISKGAFEQEDLRAIASRIPQVRAALQAAFGTNDLTQLNALGPVVIVRGLVAELAKLPKISGSVANDIENLGDAIKNAVKPLGDGLIAAFSAAQPAIEQFFKDVTARLTQVGEVIAALGKSGIVGEVLSKLLKTGEGFFGADFQKGVAQFAAKIASIVINLPDVGARFGAYLSAVFGRGIDFANYLSEAGAAIGHNIVEAFDYAVKRTQSLVAGIGNAISAIADATVNVATALAQANPIFIGFAVAMQASSAALKGLGGTLANVFLDKVADPKFTALPAFPTLKALPDLPKFDDLLAGNDERTQKLLAAIGPLSDIPENANYGKNPGLGSNTTGTPGSLDDFLAKIEKNTRQTADELSLRRQALGGGALARLGITPVELARAGVSGNAPDKGSYGLPIAGTGLERNIRQMIREEMAKGGGMPRLGG